jgi:beta-glucanase (GH16 family)
MKKMVVILLAGLLPFTQYVMAENHRPSAEPVEGLTPPPQAAAGGFGKLDFDEEFKAPLDIGYGTNGHKWNAGLWWEPVAPTSAFRVQDGVLTITNAELCTQYHDASGGTYFRGGYFEARMRCTDWSAFWLFCADRPRIFGNRVLRSNPLTWTNEIDIIETDASTPNTAVTTLHRNTSSDGGVPDQQNANNNNRMPSDQTVAQWHTYGVLWTQTAVTWYVDNVQVCTVAPYASTWQPTQLILSAQPGGVNGGKSNTVPPITQVQWVHVWN